MFVLLLSQKLEIASFPAKRRAKDASEIFFISHGKPTLVQRTRRENCGFCLVPGPGRQLYFVVAESNQVQPQ